VKDKLQTSTGGKNTLMQKSKQTKMKRGNKNMITKNYITQDYDEIILTILG
jgi:hypothetical protein